MAGALGRLKQRYSGRWMEAKAARVRGQRVVGLVGAVPVELVMAAGAFPVQIALPDGGETPAADMYMDDVISPEIHAIFEAAHRGDLSDLDLLVLTRPYDKLFYYLKEVRRIGRGASFPPFHMFDLLQSQRDAVAVYNRGQFDALIDQLQRLTGQPVTDAALRGAMMRTDAVRGLQRRLLEQRSRGLWSGPDALQAIGAARFMPIEDYARELQAALDDRAAAKVGDRRPRLLAVSSEPLNGTSLHEALEAAGGMVVAEDDLWGARAADDLGPIGQDARDTLLQRAWYGTPTNAVYPPQARQAWFRSRVQQDDVDAVIFYVPPSDHLFGWDYPAMAQWAEQQGKPHLLIRRSVAEPELRNEAAAFLRSLAVSA